MAKAAGILTNRKDNSKKKYRENEDWQAGKKIGRKKQTWVWDDEVKGVGHWEKTV